MSSADKKKGCQERVAATRQKAADRAERITGDEETHRRPDSHAGQ